MCAEFCTVFFYNAEVFEVGLVVPSPGLEGASSEAGVGGGPIVLPHVHHAGCAVFAMKIWITLHIIDANFTTRRFLRFFELRCFLFELNINIIVLQQRQDLKCQPNTANSDIFYSQPKIGPNPLKYNENVTRWHFSFAIDKFSMF